MQEVVLVIHIILALGIIGLVLIQRSEGGGLGIGGGSGNIGNLATAKGAANALTRLTAIFAAGFFITSLTLAVLASNQRSPESILESQAPGEELAEEIIEEKRQKKPSDDKQEQIPEVPVSE